MGLGRWSLFSPPRGPFSVCRYQVLSTHSYTAYRWGQKWVVLSILVRFPFASRPWALPVLVALYRSEEAFDYPQFRWRG